MSAGVLRSKDSSPDSQGLNPSSCCSGSSSRGHRPERLLSAYACAQSLSEAGPSLIHSAGRPAPSSPDRTIRPRGSASGRTRFPAPSAKRPANCPETGTSGSTGAPYAVNDGSNDGERFGSGRSAVTPRTLSPDCRLVMALRGRTGGSRPVSVELPGPGPARFPDSAWPGGALVRQPAQRVRPQTQDAVLDHSLEGRRALRRKGEPHQLGAQGDGRLTEDDRAEHQLEHDSV